MTISTLARTGLAAALALTLAGCGSNEQAAEEHGNAGEHAGAQHDGAEHAGGSESAGETNAENVTDASSDKTEMNFYDLKTNSLSGDAVNLADYRGKVTLVVNVASACGYTPQYAGLQSLHAEMADKGFAVLGFPCNDFGAQEPGSADEIQQFCESRFGVEFPMFEKISVKAGDSQSELYATLSKGADGKLPNWNFCKYLVGKDGEVIAFFPSSTSPDDADLRAKIEAAL